MPYEWRVEAGMEAHQPQMESKKENWIVYADNRAYVWKCGIHWDGEGKNADTNEYKGDRTMFYRSELIAQSGSALPDCSGDWIKFLNVDLPG